MKETAQKILLGMGIVTVGTTPIGLTRGGSKFTVEREYRPIEADGDRGMIKGRIEIDSEVAKLSVKALELFNATEMELYYPGISITPDDEMTSTKQIMTSTFSIATGDYNDIKWVGETRDGKAVTINLTNALNLKNIEWGLEDKSEVVPELEFTGTYAEDAKDTPTWNVEFAE